MRLPSRFLRASLSSLFFSRFNLEDAELIWLSQREGIYTGARYEEEKIEFQYSASRSTPYLRSTPYFPFGGRRTRRRKCITNYYWTWEKGGGGGRVQTPRSTPVYLRSSTAYLPLSEKMNYSFSIFLGSVHLAGGILCAPHRSVSRLLVCDLFFFNYSLYAAGNGRGNGARDFLIVLYCCTAFTRIWIREREGGSGIKDIWWQTELLIMYPICMQ